MLLILLVGQMINAAAGSAGYPLTLTESAASPSAIARDGQKIRPATPIGDQEFMPQSTPTETGIRWLARNLGFHVVLDNSSTHSTPEVKRWLERHKRVHFHFTRTSASWMNMIETWFSILTSKQVHRGVYHDVPELINAIEYFIEG